VLLNDLPNQRRKRKTTRSQIGERTPTGDKRAKLDPLQTGENSVPLDRAPQRAAGVGLNSPGFSQILDFGAPNRLFFFDRHFPCAPNPNIFFRWDISAPNLNFFLKRSTFLRRTVGFFRNVSPLEKKVPVEKNWKSGAAGSAYRK